MFLIEHLVCLLVVLHRVVVVCSSCVSLRSFSVSLCDCSHFVFHFCGLIDFPTRTVNRRLI